MDIEETFNNDYQNQNFNNTLVLINDQSNVPTDPNEYKNLVRAFLKLFRSTDKCSDLVKSTILNFLHKQAEIPENLWILLKDIQLLQVLIMEYCNDHNTEIKSGILRCFNTYFLLFYRDTDAFMSCPYRCCNGLQTCLTTKDFYRIYQIVCKTIVETDQQCPLTDEQMCDHIETLIVTHNFSELPFDPKTLSKALFSSVRAKLINLLTDHRSSQLIMDILIFISICNEKTLAKDNFTELHKLIIKFFSNKEHVNHHNFFTIVVLYLTKCLSLPQTFQDFKRVWKFDDVKRVIAYFVRTSPQRSSLVYLGCDLMSYIKTSGDNEWTDYFSCQLNKTSSLLDDVSEICLSDNHYQAVSGWKLLSLYVKDPSETYLETVIDTLNHEIPTTTTYLITHASESLKWSLTQRIVRTLEAVSIIVDLPPHKADVFVKIAVKKELQKALVSYLDVFFKSDHNQLLKIGDQDDCLDYQDLFCESKHWYFKAGKLAVALIFIMFQFKSQFSIAKISELLTGNKACALFALILSQSHSHIYNVMTLSLVCDGLSCKRLDVHRLAKYYENFMRVTKEIFRPSIDASEKQPFSASLSLLPTSDLKSLAEKITKLDLDSVNANGDSSDIVEMMKLRISTLMRQDASKTVQLAQKEKYISNLHEAMWSLEHTNSHLCTVNDQMTQKNIELGWASRQIHDTNYQLQQTNCDLTHEVAEVRRELETLTEALCARDSQITEARKNIKRLEKEVTEYESRCEHSKQEIQRLEKDVKEKADTIKKNEALMSQVKKLFSNQS